jgi:hypothetical protein
MGLFLLLPLVEVVGAAGAGAGTEVTVPPFALVIKSRASCSALKLLNFAFGYPFVYHDASVVYMV